MFLRLLVMILSLSVAVISPAAAVAALSWHASYTIKNCVLTVPEAEQTALSEQLEVHYRALSEPDQKRFLAVLTIIGTPSYHYYSNFIKPLTMTLDDAERACKQAQMLASREATICSYLGETYGTFSRNIPGTASTAEERGRLVEEAFARELAEKGTTEADLKALTERIALIEDLASNAQLNDELYEKTAMLRRSAPIEAKLAAYEIFVREQGGDAALQEKAAKIDRDRTQIEKIQRLAYHAGLETELQKALDVALPPAPRGDRLKPPLSHEESLAAHKRFLEAQGGMDALKAKAVEGCNFKAQAGREIQKISSQIRAVGLDGEFTRERDERFPDGRYPLKENLAFCKTFFAEHDVAKKFATKTRIDALRQLLEVTEIAEAFNRKHALEFTSKEAELAALEAFATELGGEEQLKRAVAMHRYGKIGEEGAPEEDEPLALDHIKALAEQWQAIEEAAQQLQKECPCIHKCIRLTANTADDATKTKLAANAYKEMAGQTTSTKKARNALYKRLMLKLQVGTPQLFPNITQEINPLTADLQELEKVFTLFETRFVRLAALSTAFKKACETTPALEAEIDAEYAAAGLKPADGFINRLPDLLKIFEKFSAKYKLEDAVTRVEMFLKFAPYEVLGDDTRYFIQAVLIRADGFDPENGDLAELAARAEKAEKYFGKARDRLLEAFTEEDETVLEELKEQMSAEVSKLRDDESFEELTPEQKLEKVAQTVEKIVAEKLTSSSSTGSTDTLSQHLAASSGVVARNPFLSGVVASTGAMASTALYLWTCYKQQMPTDEEGNLLPFKEYVVQEFKKRKAVYWLTIGAGALFTGGAAWSLYNGATASPAA